MGIYTVDYRSLTDKMSVEIRTEAAQFLLWEYIYPNFFAVQTKASRLKAFDFNCGSVLWISKWYSLKIAGIRERYVLSSHKLKHVCVFLV